MNTRTEIHILMDNRAAPGLAKEWGFAAAVRQNGRLWLWDTGQSSTFLANAALMGLAPQEADGLALSHGHYDHTGGLSALFNAGYHGPVFAHPDFARQRFSLSSNPARSIGIHGTVPKFTPVKEMRELSPSMTMITGIPRLPGNFQATKDFFFDAKGLMPDPVNDDAFLVLKTPKGAVVLLGCCHSGLMNSLSCMEKRLGIMSVHAVVGGLHLFDADSRAVEETVAACHRFRVRHLVPGHCSGPEAAAKMTPMLPDCEVLAMNAGQSFAYCS